MTVTRHMEQKMCEVGSGNLNWPAILEACRQAGVRWYLVERDGQGESPTDALWGDAMLAGTVLVWGALSAYVVWAG